MGFDGLTNLLPAAALPDLSDAAFSAAWDAMVNRAPSKAALYSKIETMPSLLGFSSGTFTPTTSNLSNLTSVTPQLAAYLQFGSLCFVFGTFGASVTAAAASGFNFSIPIASTITYAGQLNGAMANYGTNIRGGSIQGDTGVVRRARFSWNQNGAGGSGSVSYIYAYQVV